MIVIVVQPTGDWAEADSWAAARAAARTLLREAREQGCSRPTVVYQQEPLQTWEELLAEAEQHGWEVRLVPYCETPDSPGILGSRAGVCIPLKRLILIRETLNQDDRVTVLAHELQHAHGAGDEIDRDKPLLNLELEALDE
jgi:hypothetical protein